MLKYRVIGIFLGVAFFLNWGPYAVEELHLYGAVYFLVLVLLPSVLIMFFTPKLIKNKLDAKAKVKADKERDRQLFLVNKEKREKTMAAQKEMDFFVKEDPRAVIVMAFLKEITRLDDMIKQSPINATTYRYALEYLNYANADYFKRKNICERSLSEKHDTLMTEYKEFLYQLEPIVKGYRERKAAYHKHLEGNGSSQISVNDI